MNRILFLWFIIASALFGEYGVSVLDFKEKLNLEVNGAGPLLVSADSPRNHIILVNTNTSSVSIINGADHFYVGFEDRLKEILSSNLRSISNLDGPT